MDIKLKNYYSLIDLYKTDNDDIEYYNDNDPDEEIFFKNMLPINICMIERYLEPIINYICKKFGSEEKALKETDDIIKRFKSNSGDINLNEYKIGDISLIDFLRGDYNFLKKYFIIEDRYVPNINNYINNFTYPETDLTYPFSLKELFNMLVERGIKVFIHNYFLPDEEWKIK